LRVQFRSPVTVSRNRYEEQLMDYIVPPRCVPPEYQVRSPFFVLMSRIFFCGSGSWDFLFLFYLSGLQYFKRLQRFQSRESTDCRANNALAHVLLPNHLFLSNGISSITKGRMPRQFHPENASFFQLGLGACFPFHGSVVGLRVIIYLPSSLVMFF